MSVAITEVDLADEDWKARLEDALERFGAVKLVVDSSRSADFRAALVVLLVTPVDVGFLQFFPPWTALNVSKARYRRPSCFGSRYDGFTVPDLHGPAQSRAVRDLLQGLFAAELIHPSAKLWLFFAWITDIELLDNSARQFSALAPDWPATQIRLRKCSKRYLSGTLNSD